MTKTAKTAPKAEAAAEGYFASIKETLESVQNKIEVPAAAREFVKRGAATGMERAESVHENALKLTDGAERFASAFIGGYGRFARGLLDMTYANVQHGLETVQKVAGAKSLSEATQIQADYVRESVKSNFDRVKAGYDVARGAVVDGAKTLQTEVSSLYGSAGKTA